MLLNVRRNHNAHQGHQVTSVFCLFICLFSCHVVELCFVLTWFVCLFSCHVVELCFVLTWFVCLFSCHVVELCFVLTWFACFPVMSLSYVSSSRGLLVFLSCRWAVSSSRGLFVCFPVMSLSCVSFSRGLFVCLFCFPVVSLSCVSSSRDLGGRQSVAVAVTSRAVTVSV